MPNKQQVLCPLVQQAAVPSVGHLLGLELLPSLQSACMLCRKPVNLPLHMQQLKQLLLLWVLRKKSSRPEVQSWRAAVHLPAMVQRSQACKHRQLGSQLHTEQLMQVSRWNIWLILLAEPMDLVMRALLHTDSDADVDVAGLQETPRKRGQMLPPPSRTATPKAAAESVPPTVVQHQSHAVSLAQKATQAQECLQQTTPSPPESMQASAAELLRENTQGCPQETAAPAICSAHVLPALQQIHLPKTAVRLPTGQDAIQNAPPSLQPGQTFLPLAAK